MPKKGSFLSTFLPLLFASAASAQVTTGIAVTKTCPNGFITPGATFTCSGRVQNLDPDNAIVGLVVVNTPQGSSPTAVPCTVGGSPVTVLQPNGTPGDTCLYSALETAPACGPKETLFIDVIQVSGTDSGANTPVSGSAVGAVQIPPCTPTPNGTPTNTPTGGTTATLTPTNTRTSTPASTATSTATATPPNTTPTGTPPNTTPTSTPTGTPPNTTPTTTPTLTPTTTRTNTPTTTPTGAPTSVATGTPAVTGTPTNLRRQPREIPFRPTITADEIRGNPFQPLLLLAATLIGAWALSRR